MDDYKKQRLADEYGVKSSKRKSALKRLYGITPEQFLELVIAQDNKCYLCQKEMKPMKNIREVHGAAVEHDHETGKVRGLAHMICNRALGVLGDSSKSLREMADRLDESEHRSQEILHGVAVSLEVKDEN